MRCCVWLGLISGIIGAGIPLAYGLRVISAATSSPPLPPDVVSCGMPLLGAYFAIGIGAPVGAYCFATAGMVVGAALDVVLYLFNRWWDGAR